MAITVAKLAEYMENELNIYISGEAGTGKTRMLMAAAKKLKLEMGYMSAPTLDAYVDLVGIPVAKMDKALKKRVLQFIRKSGFGDIQVLFVDELPRGELKTLNAIFELIQFGTINGEIAMPKLKCVVGAGNPMTEDYNGQQELDLALLDRFDMYLETDTKADPGYFTNTFGKTVGLALTSWHSAHDHKEKGYLSPRRLEKIGHTWLKMPEVGTLKAMMPPRGEFNVDLLQSKLEKASAQDRYKDDDSAPIQKRISMLSSDQIKEKREEILKSLPNLSKGDLAQTTGAIARTVRTGYRITALVEQWGPAFEYFAPSDTMDMMGPWSATKNTEFMKAITAAGISIGKNLVKVPAAN